MEFNLLLKGIFDGLIQIYSNIQIGGVDVDFFLPEWNIVIFRFEKPSLRELDLIRGKILEYGGDDFPVVFLIVLQGNQLKIINSILRIASCELYWCPNGHQDHREWVNCLGETNKKQKIMGGVMSIETKLSQFRQIFEEIYEEDTYTIENDLFRIVFEQKSGWYIELKQKAHKSAGLKPQWTKRKHWYRKDWRSILQEFTNHLEELASWGELEANNKLILSDCYDELGDWVDVLNKENFKIINTLKLANFFNDYTFVYCLWKDLNALVERVINPYLESLDVGGLFEKELQNHIDKFLEKANNMKYGQKGFDLGAEIERDILLNV